jgi:hypothetical protein
MFDVIWFRIAGNNPTFWPDVRRALIWCLLGQFDQCFEGIAIVFKGVFNALWYLIWHVGACYARKLQQVLVHQVPTRPFECIVAAVF